MSKNLDAKKKTELKNNSDQLDSNLIICYLISSTTIRMLKNYYTLPIAKRVTNNEFMIF